MEFSATRKFNTKMDIRYLDIWCKYTYKKKE